MDYESLCYVMVSVALLMAFAAWDYYRRWKRSGELRRLQVEAFNHYTESLLEQRAQIERASLKHWKRAQELEADNELLLEKLADAEREAGVQGHLADRAALHDACAAREGRLVFRIEELEEQRDGYRENCRELKRKLDDTRALVSAADAARGYGKSMDAAPVTRSVRSKCKNRLCPHHVVEVERNRRGWNVHRHSLTSQAEPGRPDSQEECITSILNALGMLAGPMPLPDYGSVCGRCLGKGCVLVKAGGLQTCPRCNGFFRKRHLLKLHTRPVVGSQAHRKDRPAMKKRSKA